MMLKACSTSWQRNNLKVQPHGIEERPQNDMSSQRNTRGRFLSTRKLLLEAKKQRQFKSVSSTTVNHTTHAMTSMSINDRSTGTPRNEGTAHTTMAL